VTLLALGLILSAAIFHATWNLQAKQAGGGAAFVWLFGMLAALIYAPLAIVVIVLQRPEIGHSQLFFMAGSILLHMAYFLLLQQGYRVGDLLLVCSMACGTGPMLSTIGAILILGERPGPVGLLGAGLIVLGIILLTGSVLSVRAASRAGLGFGVLT
jgi:drug/metabolite transporter (DMT)-like permease